MKKEYLPYYLTRFGLSLGFSLLVFGWTWWAGLSALVFSAGFLLYLHSGWFRVDPSNSVFPLRRDEHGQAVQRRALIAGLVTGMLIYFAGGFVLGDAGIPPRALASLSFSAAVLVYFFNTGDVVSERALTPDCFPL